MVAPQASRLHYRPPQSRRPASYASDQRDRLPEDRPRHLLPHQPMASTGTPACSSPRSAATPATNTAANLILANIGDLPKTVHRLRRPRRSSPRQRLPPRDTSTRSLLNAPSVPAVAASLGHGRSSNRSSSATPSNSDLARPAHTMAPCQHHRRHPLRASVLPPGESRKDGTGDQGPQGIGSSGNQSQLGLALLTRIVLPRDERKPPSQQYRAVAPGLSPIAIDLSDRSYQPLSL